MKPVDVDNDRYNYHLQYLVKQHLIIKHTDSYELSEIGKKYILETQPIDIVRTVADKFKLAALCLVLRDTGQGLEALYQTRSVQPFIGNKELIGGSIYKGEMAAHAATRRLREESGLLADFSLFGCIRKIRYDEDDTLYSDILYHICTTSNCTGELIEDNQFGKKEWVSLDDAIRQESTATYGSQQFASVLQQLKSTPPSEIPLFYFEEIAKQNIY
jgi:8-oxo-dGTP pyrophosphatase MutT (NUDIX family)